MGVVAVLLDPQLIEVARAVPPSRCANADGQVHAARHALLDMIDYLQTRGSATRVAYARCSVAVDLRVSECVNGPNAMVSALLPLDTFE